ncbi:Ldh family oxidoreductase [Actinomadura viridis]|uniref:LDH2 family malate/lactate/ureidoglycolate dehydrogenase n=1 Tax=Actinomadura viridis TaxID=58110 RepID=A0A931DLA3_9ACTN|nr:Ldh family oxidoreductase [Actinomadura viridis]MBG6088718.1 LDH2 family malate/lactate/ureidoglycolate dehydrogenase [Actinomadura viridis]
MAGTTTVPADWLTEAVTGVFRGGGLSARAARTVAESLVAADLRGVASHGVLLVPMYMARLRDRSVTARERAEVVLDHGAVAVLDARHALGQLTGDQAMGIAVAKAHAHGVGAVTVRHAFHFGAAFRYAAAAAEAGCVGVAAANTRPLMPAPGGAEPVTGNNPLAIAVPRAGGDPVVLDMALSEAALGKIRLAAQEDRPIPAHWATDAEGRPTTDPRAALAGMLLPAAGPKGFGLALMIDVLAGVLSGGAYGSGVNGLYADTTVPNDCAHFFLALDVAAFGDPGRFAQHLDDLLGQVTGARRAPGTDRLLLPGQLEAARAATARENGVPVGDAALRALMEEAARAGIALVLPPGAGEGGERGDDG